MSFMLRVLEVVPRCIVRFQLYFAPANNIIMTKYLLLHYMLFVSL
jgi:hypothetical protein